MRPVVRTRTLEYRCTHGTLPVGGHPQCSVHSGFQHSASAFNQHTSPKYPECGSLTPFRSTYSRRLFECRAELACANNVNSNTTTPRRSCRTPCNGGMEATCLRILFRASRDSRQIVRLTCLDASDAVLETQSGTRWERP